MSKALYRKYRPTKLAEVVGQPQVTEVLASALKQGKVGHAYLFIGPRGTGKTSVARIFAHEVNGFPYTIEDDYVDIVEIDGASNRGIDNIRELREKVAIAPTAGKYKIYIIDEVHMLTKEAFNALLKTLEEPPEHVIFIMATTDAHKVPVTITSRAQTYTFKLAEPAVMVAHLSGICDKEGIKIADGALELIVKRGGGSFRDSLSLLDQISTLSDAEITREMVISALGLPDVVKITTLFDDFVSCDVVKITTVVKDLLSSGVKPETIAEEMIAQIIDNPRPELLPLLAKLPEVKAPFAEAKLLVALLGCGAKSDNSRDASSRPSLRGSSLTRSSSVAKTLESSDSRAQQTAVVASDVSPEGIRSAAARGRAPAARGDGPAGRGPRGDMLAKTPASQEMQDTSDLTPTNFDWDEFIGKIQRLNDVIYNYLTKSQHDVVGNTLNIYPSSPVMKNILSKENNKKILIDNAGGMRVDIHDAGEKPQNAQKDALLTKISDIMGGEVTNDGGGNPF